MVCALTPHRLRGTFAILLFETSVPIFKPAVCAIADVEDVARAYVIRSYYKRGLSLRVVVEQAGVSESALYDYKSKIIGQLKDLDHLAQGELDARLQPLLGQ